jgi:hypothetical protein
MAREARTDKIALAKVAVQCSAEPDALGWLIIRPWSIRITKPLADIYNHCKQVAKIKNY